MQLLAHFSQAEEDERERGVKNDTRAMVFCSFRDCVLEVVVSAHGLQQ
jgi:ATP-dependent DNA helicase MPH1